MRRRKDESKKKLYMGLFILILVLLIWMGNKDIANDTQDVVVDITEQIKK